MGVAIARCSSGGYAAAEPRRSQPGAEGGHKVELGFKRSARLADHKAVTGGGAELDLRALELEFGPVEHIPF